MKSAMSPSALPSFEATCELLRNLAPPTTLIHVGAGNGAGIMHSWHDWQVPDVHLIDVDAMRLAWAEKRAHIQNRQVHTAILGNNEELCFWHSTSNPDEDGLKPVAELRELWPRLREVKRTQSQCTTLDALLPVAAQAQNGDAWIFVDCLPALAVLNGAQAWLAHTSVLGLRVLIEDLPSFTEDSTLTAIEQWLLPQGFRKLHVTESNHPALGHALFVRDWHSTLRAQIQTQEQENFRALAEQRRLASEWQQQSAQFAQAREEFAATIESLEEQIAKLTSGIARVSEEKVVLEASLNAAREQALVLTQARDEQAGLVQEIQNQVAELMTALNEQRSLTEEHQQQLVNVNQARATLDEENSSLRKQLQDLMVQMRASQELAREAEKKVAEMEAEVAERDARQRMLNEEISRAEAQIDLIKDILLREPGL